MTSSPRIPSAVDVIAEDWVDTQVSLSPMLGTYIGRSEGNGHYDDFSLEGQQEYIRAIGRTLNGLRAVEPSDVVDEVTKADLIRTLELEQEVDQASWHLRDLNVIASPAQAIREVFDLMPTSTDQDWATIARRMGAVEEALRGYQQTLSAGIAAGTTPAVRQVIEVADQIERFIGEDGFFVDFVGKARLANGNELPQTLARDLGTASSMAREAYAEFREFLVDRLAPVATTEDAVGRDLYALHSRRFLGAAIDLDEAYEWGKAELARMVAEQEKIAQQILPGASVAEAVEFLDRDPARILNGPQELQQWMQRVSDEAVAELGREQFDIPEPIRQLECMIAPTNEGGIYYTGPTDDFSRPGRMWWSVPEGVTQFNTWRELTTVYHEGVPGHHLQIAQAVYLKDQLNSWRRLIAGTSGHAEGWALYAERLMEELGYLDDPADRLGMLDGQRMRAARVVLDIGVHLGKPRLEGGGVWDADYALEFLGQNVNMSPEFVRFETLRYLGWPGQAPSYKVGQRIWESIRDDASRAAGDAFSLRDFHSRALSIGGVGLDTLREAMAGGK